MSKDNEVIFYTDGRHTSVYIYEPPMDKRIYTALIDALVDLGIHTICYALGDCRVVLYDTKVGEKWGHNVNKTNHIIWYRAIWNSLSRTATIPSRSSAPAPTNWALPSFPA